MIMDDTKDFEMMTPAEQLQWVTDWRKFNAEKLPALCLLGDSWEQAHIKSFKEGLALLNAFRIARDFVKQSLYYGDFSRRINLFQHNCNEIERLHGTSAAFTTPSGDTLAVVETPVSDKPRRGRPAKAKPEDTPEAPSATPAVGDLFATAVSTQLGDDERPALRQLYWLLPTQLVERAKEVSFLRAEAARAAEQAKTLADSRAKAELIAPHSQAACDYTEKYLQVYEDIDIYLAVLYRNVKNQGIPAQLAEDLKARGIDNIEALLLPYYNKVSNNGENESFVPAPVAEPKPEATEDDKARRKAIEKIRKYFQRNDMKPSAKRCERMRQYIAEAETLGDENLEAYKLRLAKEEAELSNPNPTEE